MFTGKVVFITGATRGLGRAVMEEILSKGGKVFFTYLENDTLADEIQRNAGDTAACCKADAACFEDAEKAVRQAMDTFGQIDILINNAAAARHGPVERLSLEDWDYSIRHTLYPVFNYTHAVLPHFIAQGGGNIVNIGSINGLRGREGSASYCAAKAGIVGFSKTVAKEMGRHHINCNVVAPGYIDTDGQAQTSELIKKMVREECCIPELATPAQVAKMVIFLASQEAGAITGQVYRVDFGQYV